MPVPGVNPLSGRLAFPERFRDPNGPPSVDLFPVEDPLPQPSFHTPRFRQEFADGSVLHQPLPQRRAPGGSSQQEATNPLAGLTPELINKLRETLRHPQTTIGEKTTPVGEVYDGLLTQAEALNLPAALFTSPALLESLPALLRVLRRGGGRLARPPLPRSATPTFKSASPVNPGAHATPSEATTAGRVSVPGGGFDRRAAEKERLYRLFKSASAEVDQPFDTRGVQHLLQGGRGPSADNLRAVSSEVEALRQQLQRVNKR